MRAANFVEETTTSIAGTSGNGAVTLTAIASTPRFSTVFGTGATTIRYVIEDTVGKKFETGIGSVASNVLTRSRPQVTWDGTTYDDSAPSPIAFGSTPTSGDIKIRLSQTAENSLNALPGINLTIAGGDPDWQFYRPSANNWINSLTGRTLVANREYYHAYRLDHAGLLSGVQFQVTTLVAASNMKLALYGVGTNGFPSNKLLDFNTADTSTTGLKTDAATGTWSPAGPIWLTPGWYYIGYIPSHAIAINGSGGSNFLHAPSPVGRQNNYGWTDTCFASGNYATGLPANPTITDLAAVNEPQARHTLGLRVVP